MEFKLTTLAMLPNQRMVSVAADDAEELKEAEAVTVVVVETDLNFPAVAEVVVVAAHSGLLSRCWSLDFHWSELQNIYLENKS